MNTIILGLIVILCMMGDFIATKTGLCVALLIICVAILGHLFFKHKREVWEREKEAAQKRENEFDESKLYN